MKFFSSLSLFTLSIGAVSTSTLDRRDLATIQQVLTTISQQVDALDKTVKAFTGDAGAIITASGNLLGVIRSGTTQVTATSLLNQDEALAIATYVTGLNASVATVVNDLISQKSALVAACAGEIVFQDLTQQKTESDSLAFAITSKVPADLKNLANELSSGIATSLSYGINSFQGAIGGPTCPAPTSGPAPPSSAPFPPGSSTGIAAPIQPSDSFTILPEQPSSTGPASPAYPTSSGSLDLPPVSNPSSSDAFPPASAPSGGSSSPNFPSDNAGASSPASGSTGSSSGSSYGSSSGSSSGSSPGGSSGGSYGSYSGSSSSSDTYSSPPKSISAPPAVFTGGASASQVGTSTLAFVVGCIVLFL